MFMKGVPSKAYRGDWHSNELNCVQMRFGFDDSLDTGDTFEPEPARSGESER